MSEVVTKAVQKLGEKIDSFDSVAKFVITGEGAIMIDEDGVRAGDEDAEVTLTASRETFATVLGAALASVADPRPSGVVLRF